MSVKDDSLSDQVDKTAAKVSSSPSSSRRLLQTNPNSTLLPWITAPPAPTSKYGKKTVAFYLLPLWLVHINHLRYVRFEYEVSTVRSGVWLSVHIMLN